MKVRHCLVCLKDISGTGSGSDVENTPRMFIDNGSEECNLLSRQLPVIFLLRKLIEIPNEMCSQFLNSGDPCSWIHWCDTCSALVNNAKVVFDKIASLQKQFDKVRIELKNLIRLSEKARQGHPPSINDMKHSENGFLEVVRSYVIDRDLCLPSVAIPKVEVEVEVDDNSQDDSFSYYSDHYNNYDEYSSLSESIKDDNYTEESTCVLPRKNPKRTIRKLPLKPFVKKVKYLQKKRGRKPKTRGHTVKSEVENCDVLTEGKTENSNEESVDSKSNKKFHCTHCHKRFRNVYYLRKHMKFHNLERPHGCDLCKKRFVRLNDLTDHLATHTSARPYVCKECGKSFRQGCSLGRHKKSEQCGLVHECTVCQETFNQLSKLKLHLSRVHEIAIAGNPKKYRPHSPRVCDICGKTLSRPQDLRRHLLTHTGERPYSCSVCGKKFKQSGEVNVHLRTHTGEKPFKCIVCDKRFKTRQESRVHAKIHDRVKKERSFLCTICGKKLSDSHRLKLHVMNHTGDKPHCCETCGHKFTTAQHLKRHIKVHTGEKPFLCSSCGKSFPTQSQVKSHERCVHLKERPHQCLDCGKKFSELSNLRKHSKTHSVSADPNIDYASETIKTSPISIVHDETINDVSQISNVNELNETLKSISSNVSENSEIVQAVSAISNINDLN